MKSTQVLKLQAPYKNKDNPHVPYSPSFIRISGGQGFLRGEIVRLSTSSSYCYASVKLFGSSGSNKLFVHYNTQSDLRAKDGAEIQVTHASRFQKLFVAPKYMLEYHERLQRRNVMILNLITILIAVLGVVLAIISLSNN